MPRDRFNTRAEIVEILRPKPSAYLETRSSSDGWSVSARWEVVDDRLEPVTVTVTSATDRRRVSAAAIRKLSIGEMLNDGRTALRELSRVPERFPEMAPYWRSDVIEPSTQVGSPQRGRSLSDDDLKAVVEVYREARLIGHPVNEAVREAFYLSRDGAAKRIGKARKMLRERGEEL